MSSVQRNVLRVLFAGIYVSIVALQSLWVAVAFHVLSRLAYIGYVGFALRAQTKSEYFTRKYGRDAGYARFQAYASFIMNNDGLSFFVLAAATFGTLDWGVPVWVWILNGVLLTATGVFFKVWAKNSLKDTGGYYWRDFFIPQFEANYVPTGPYQFFKNPMYTIGSAHLYGIPLMLASWPGLIFGALFDHCMIFVLYFWVERPNYIRLYSPKDSPKESFQVAEMASIADEVRATVSGAELSVSDQAP